MKPTLIDSLLQSDFQSKVSSYIEEIRPDHRYASFDYCYNYFYRASPDELINKMERSCMTLGFYLASWGMLRGSAFLLEKSARYFYPVIEYIAEQDRSLWEIDVDCYTERNIGEILRIYSEIKNLIVNNGSSHKILVTKIMLGVFGFVPAYDSYFCYTFGEIFKGECAFSSVSKTSLHSIRKFYEANQEQIDTMTNQLYTLDFNTGNYSRVRYKKAKVIDMYGFTRGNMEKPNR